jgi:hypothetical protein
MSTNARNEDARTALTRVAQACDDMSAAWAGPKRDAIAPSDDDVYDRVMALKDSIGPTKDSRLVDVRDGLDDAAGTIQMQGGTPEKVAGMLDLVAVMAREDARPRNSLEQQAAVTASEARPAKGETPARGPSAMPPFGATLARRVTER